MIGIFEALWTLIKNLAINGYNYMSIGDLYIPNTNVIGSKQVNNVPVSTYYNSSAGSTVDSASHNASQQVFDFYWGLSPYLHMVKPSTQFLRTWTSWIADGLYGIDSFLTYLYVNLFSVMGIRSSYSPSSGFFNLLHDGQLLGVVACVIATICYFGAMMLAPNGETIAKLKILFRNIILGGAIIGFLPTISNTFIVGTQYEAQQLIGNGTTSGTGEHMDSMAADYFRQNVISVPHKIASMGLKPNGVPKGKNSSKNKGGDSTYGIQVPESHNRIVYRPKSTFYTPDPNDGDKAGNKPIASKQISINLYAMSDQERNTWNGLNSVSVPSFLHEYGSDDSIIDPNGNNDKYDKVNKGKQVNANKRITEATESPKLREKLIHRCEKKSSALNCRLNVYPKWKWMAKLNQMSNDQAEEASNDFKGGHKIMGNVHEVFTYPGSIKKSGNANYIGTIMPAKQMIENLTVIAHAQSTKKGSKQLTKNKNNKQKSIKQTNKGNKQQTTKADKKSSENSDDDGIGLYNYQLDGDDDYASIDKISQSFMSKHVSGGSMTSYYDKYKVCWFNIITGLLLLGFMLCAFIAKIATSFFKISVMYISVGIFMYKAVSAPQAWKEFIKAFFGIYEMLFMDVLMLRLWLMACFALDADVSTIVTNYALGATDLVTGGITLVCNFAMAMAALHGVGAVDKLMGPGANSGASHSWGDALAAVTAMRIAGGVGRTGTRLAGAPFRMGGSAVSGAGSALSKHHANSMRKKAATGQNAFQRAKGHLKNGANAIKHPKRALNGFDKANPKTHFKGQASNAPTPKQERLAKKLNAKHGKLSNKDNAVNGKKGNHKNGIKNNKANGKHFKGSANPLSSNTPDNNDTDSGTTNGLNGENQDNDTGDNLDDSESDTSGNDINSAIDDQFGDSNSADNDDMSGAKSSASVASRHNKANNQDAFGNSKPTQNNNNHTTGTNPKTTKPNPNSRKDLTTRTANGLQHTGNGLTHIGNGINRLGGNPANPTKPVDHNTDTNTDGTVGKWQPQDGIDGQGTNASASDNQPDAFGNTNDSTTGTEPDMSDVDNNTDATAPSSNASTSNSSSADNNVADFDKNGSQSSASNSNNMSADNINPNHIANSSNSASSSSNSGTGHINNDAVGTAGNDVSSATANNATGASGNNSTGSTNGQTGTNNTKPNIRHQHINVHHHKNNSNASQNRKNGSHNNTTGNPTTTETTTTNSTDGATPTNHFTGQDNDVDNTPNSNNSNQSSSTTKNVTGSPITNGTSGNNVVSNNSGNTTGNTGHTIIHRHINNINDNSGDTGNTTTTTDNTSGGNPDNTTGNEINSEFTPSGETVSGNNGTNNPSNHTTTTTNNGSNNNSGNSLNHDFDQIVNMTHHNFGGGTTTTHFTNQTDGITGNTPSSTTTTTDSNNTNVGSNNGGTHTIHNVINHQSGNNNTGGHTTIHRHINHINSTDNGSTPNFTTTTTNNTTPNSNEPGDKDLYQSFNKIAHQVNSSNPVSDTTTTQSSGYNAFSPNNNNQHQQILGSDEDNYIPDNDTTNTDTDNSNDHLENSDNDLTSGLFRGLTGGNDDTNNPHDFTGNHGNHLNGTSDYTPHTPHFNGSANDWNSHDEDK